MKNFRNKFFTGALALGLFVGGAGIATAASSTDYQQKVADWVKNDHNQTIMNTSSPSSSTPIATDSSDIKQAPVSPITPSQHIVKEQAPTHSTPQKPAVTQPTPKPVQPKSNQNNQYYCNDSQGHSYMNSQQHQEWHNTKTNQSAQPSSKVKNTNNITTNGNNTNYNMNHDGQNHNSMGGNHNGGHE